MDFFLIEKKGILFNREKSEKILVQNFGGNTALGSVSFVGWWVGGWYTFFRPHSGSELSIYPSYARSSLAPLGKNTIYIVINNFFMERLHLSLL